MLNICIPLVLFYLSVINFYISGDDGELQCFDCPFVAPSASSLRKHMSQRHASKSSSSDTLSCPLCNYSLSDLESLEGHLFSIHNVNKDGAQRLISLMDTSSWKPKDDCMLPPIVFLEFTFRLLFTDLDFYFSRNRGTV